MLIVVMVKLHHEVEEAIRLRKQYMKNPWNCIQVCVTCLHVCRSCRQLVVKVCEKKRQSSEHCECEGQPVETLIEIFDLDGGRAFDVNDF